MSPAYRPAGQISCYFAKDSSGVVVYCAAPGDTHFLHVDAGAMQQLLEKPAFHLEELRQALSLDSDEASELAGQLVALGVIDEIG